MKLVIVGSKGMLGQYLLSVFQQPDKYEVFALDKTELDITKEEEVLKVLQDLRPELVINAAAYNDVEKCEEDMGYNIALTINRDGVKNLSQACKLINTTLVHYSTDYVFDGKKREGYKEGDKPNPISRYGQSKFWGEEVLLSANLAKYYLIRTSRLFGASGTSGIAKKSFVDLMLTLSQKTSTINAVNKEISSPTYAKDLALATKEIIETKASYGIYHRTNSASCDWYDFAKEIFKIKKIKVNIIPVTRSFFGGLAKRPAFSILLNNKLSPMRSWQAALAEYLNES